MAFESINLFPATRPEDILSASYWIPPEDICLEILGTVCRPRTKTDAIVFMWIPIDIVAEIPCRLLSTSFSILASPLCDALSTPPVAGPSQTAFLRASTHVPAHTGPTTQHPPLGEQSSAFRDPTVDGNRESGSGISLNRNHHACSVVIGGGQGEGKEESRMERRRTHLLPDEDLRSRRAWEDEIPASRSSRASSHIKSASPLRPSEGRGESRARYVDDDRGSRREDNVPVSSSDLQNARLLIILHTAPSSTRIPL